MALSRDEFLKLTKSLFYMRKVNLMGTPYIIMEDVINIISDYSEDLAAKITPKSDTEFTLSYKEKK